MTKMKFCGMRRPADIAAVNEALPDYVGFICTERFWRYIPPEQALGLKQMLDPRIRAVGVFVDEPLEKIVDYLKKGILDAVQLHGSESEYYIRQLQNVMLFQGTRVPIIRAFRIKTDSDLVQAQHSIADLVLLDNGTGTGETFDWSILRDIGRPFFLAGGLGPDNVADAIAEVRPYGVDMSSGLETDHVKDADKIRRAAAAIRSAETPFEKEC